MPVLNLPFVLSIVGVVVGVLVSDHDLDLRAHRFQHPRQLPALLQHLEHREELVGFDELRLLDEVANLEHGRSAHAGLKASRSSAKWQAEHWPVPSMGRRTGISARHSSWA